MKPGYFDVQQHLFPVRRLRQLLLLIYIAAVFRLWIMPLGSSFWLDETLTYWNVMKGVSEVFERSAACAGQFQLYMFIAALSAKFFGLNEIGLRLPSIIAAIGSSWLMFQLGRRFADTETGIFSSILFVCIPEITLQTGNARPYALLIFCSLLAVWQLVKLHDTGEWRHAAGYAAAAAAMLYIHYISAPFLLVLAFYSALRFKSITPNKVFCAHTALMLLIAPLVIFILRTAKDTAIISFVDTPDVKRLWNAVFSPFILFAISIFLVCKLFLRSRVESFFPLYERQVSLFTIVWLLLPISVCYFVSILSDHKIFVDRYYIIAYPSLALLIAAALQKIRHTMFRQLSLISLCMISLLTISPNELYPSLHHEDWRGALAAVKTMAEPTGIPLFFNSGLVETLQPGWELQSAEHHLLSPLSAYPVKTRVIPLPIKVDSKSRPYFNMLISKEILSTDRFIVVLRRASSSADKWIAEYAQPRGFVRSESGSFSGVLVVLYKQKNL